MKEKFTIALFDKREGSHYGIKFNGQIETEDRTLFAYLDFMAPANLYNKLSKEQKEAWEETFMNFERSWDKLYVSGIKHPITKEFEDGLAVLHDAGDGIFRITLEMKQKSIDWSWMEKPDENKERYVSAFELGDDDETEEEKTEAPNTEAAQSK